MCAVNTTCGHSFCERCIFEFLFHSTSCPICRTEIEIDDLISNKLAQKIVEDFITESKPELSQLHSKRRDEMIDWKESRRLKKIEEGELVDLRDSENVWCVARIKKVLDNHSHKRTLLMHYEKWDSVYDEFVCENSPRLASKGFFTSRKGRLIRYPKASHCRCRRWHDAKLPGQLAKRRSRQ